MKKKNIALLLSAVLVLAGVVGVTIAWLTDNTDTVTNTFTVGDINIDLYETDSEEDADENALTNSYKMIPGNTIAKDPTVKVDAKSEACWLFVKVDESATLHTYIEYGMADGWFALDGQQGVYYRKVAATGESHETFAVLAGNNGGQVTVKADVTKAQMNALQEEGAVQPTLSFKAYAVQQANVTTVADAWAKRPVDF